MGRNMNVNRPPPEERYVILCTTFMGCASMNLSAVIPYQRFKFTLIPLVSGQQLWISRPKAVAPRQNLNGILVTLANVPLAGRPPVSVCGFLVEGGKGFSSFAGGILINLFCLFQTGTSPELSGKVKGNRPPGEGLF